MVNKEKIKGAWNETVGEVKEHLGRAIDNPELERKGHQQEMKGKAQKAVGEIKDRASKVKDDLNEGFKSTKF